MSPEEVTEIILRARRAVAEVEENINEGTNLDKQARLLGELSKSIDELMKVAEDKL